VEELVLTGTGAPELVDRSPMAKVPFLDTGRGCISESIACAEYIEAPTRSSRCCLPTRRCAATSWLT
jgi:glutathione S-transferase